MDYFKVIRILIMECDWSLAATKVESGFGFVRGMDCYYSTFSWFLDQRRKEYQVIVIHNFGLIFCSFHHILKIDNQGVKSNYRSYKKRITRDNDGDPNVRRFFHATKLSEECPIMNHRKLCKIGDCSVCGILRQGKTQNQFNMHFLHFRYFCNKFTHLIIQIIDWNFIRIQNCSQWSQYQILSFWSWNLLCSKQFESKWLQSRCHACHPLLQSRLWKRMGNSRRPTRLDRAADRISLRMWNARNSSKLSGSCRL